MATLTIRNLPEAVHAELKSRARENRRSLNQEVIAELINRNAHVRNEADDRWRARAMIARARQLRVGMKRFMTAGEIDSAVEEGRR